MDSSSKSWFWVFLKIWYTFYFQLSLV
jgi:hypothetical protein